MSEEEVREKIGNGSELLVLQKAHVVLLIIGIIAISVSTLLYSGNRLNRVEEDIKLLQTKTEALQEMKSDIRHITETIIEIKDYQKGQEEAIKEFYKIYKLEKK